MIAPDFYVPKNLTAISGVQYYKPRPKAVVLGSKEYTVRRGDTSHSIALRLFGSTNQYYWTIIEDINKPSKSLGYNTGDVINLPTIIVKTL